MNYDDIQPFVDRMMEVRTEVIAATKDMNHLKSLSDELDDREKHPDPDAVTEQKANITAAMDELREKMVNWVIELRKIRDELKQTVMTLKSNEESSSLPCSSANKPKKSVEFDFEPERQSSTPFESDGYEGNTEPEAKLRDEQAFDSSICGQSYPDPHVRPPTTAAPNRLQSRLSSRAPYHHEYEPYYDTGASVYRPAPNRTAIGSSVKVPRPNKYQSTENFERFSERFSEYCTLANILDNNLHLHLLGLVDNETYDKLKRVELTPLEKSRCDLFIPKYVEALYPRSETRTLRVEFSKLSQKHDESVDEFANRIRDMASRAYDTKNIELKEESSLLTFIQGLQDADIKIKLYEAEVDTLDAALLLARKHIKINNTVRKTSEDFQLLKISSEDTSGTDQRTAANAPVDRNRDYQSYDRSQSGGSQSNRLVRQSQMGANTESWASRPYENCPYNDAPTFDNRRGGVSNSTSRYNAGNRSRSDRRRPSETTQCYRCWNFGHVQRYCPYLNIPSNSSTQSDSRYQQMFPYSHAIQNTPYHPSQQMNNPGVASNVSNHLNYQGAGIRTGVQPNSNHQQNQSASQDPTRRTNSW